MSEAFQFPPAPTGAQPPEGPAGFPAADAGGHAPGDPPARAEDGPHRAAKVVVPAGGGAGPTAAGTAGPAEGDTDPAADAAAAPLAPPVLRGGRAPRGGTPATGSAPGRARAAEGAADG